MSYSRRAFISAAAAASTFVMRSAGAAPLTLQVSATPSIFKQMFVTLCREFERAHPGVRVALSANSRSQDDEFLATLRRALIRELPDVSFQAFSYLRDLAQRSLLVPLNELIAKDPAWTADRFPASLAEIGSVGRAVYGLGAGVSVPMVFYDAAKVEAAWGPRPMPPDWESMLELIVELGRREKRPALGAFCQHDTGNWIYSSIVEGLGGRLMTPNERRIAFDQPPGQQTLEIFRAFGRAGQFRADMSIDQARQAFVAGTIGLIVDSSSTLSLFERQIGGRFALGSARLPLAPGGRVPVSGIASVLLAREPARQQAAWQFMRFVSGPAGQQIIGRSSGYFPANELVASRSDWLGAYYASRSLARPVIETLPLTVRSPGFPGDNASKIDAVIHDQVASIITLTKTPEQALRVMTDRVQQLLPATLA